MECEDFLKVQLKPPYKLNVGVYNRVGNINLRRDVTDEDLKNLATKGKDFYTGMTWYHVREVMGVENFLFIRGLQLSEKEKFDVARWVCRGLRMDLAIRKAKINKNRR